MGNGKSRRVPRTVIWCLGLTLLSACQTAPAGEAVSADTEAVLTALTPPRPAAPVTEPVAFADRDRGLYLAYERYRALERNIIALREYAARL
jgi:hypothetical protein